MNKSLKLNLKDLRVNSFVTSLEKDDVERIKGGWVTTTAVFTNPLDYLCNSYQCPPGGGEGDTDGPDCDNYEPPE